MQGEANARLLDKNTITPAALEETLKMHKPK